MAAAGILAVVSVSYELTPTPVLGHPDPHGTGLAGGAQGVLSAGDRAIARLPGSSSAPSPGPPPAAIGDAARRTGTWIEIPALRIALPVGRGDGTDRIPDWQALVYPGTSWPGQPGNSYLYAHGLWGMFGGLLYARVGDAASVHDYDAGRVQTLRVTRVVGRIAYDDDRWMLFRTSRTIVTLQTCVDYARKGDRFVVQLS